jgi:hypothetical protein
MEKSGMIFGADNKPIQEKSFEEFAGLAGFKPTGTGTGRPYFYMVDREAGNFRFGCPADQAYQFTPVYFKKPPLPAVDSSGDSSTVWLDDDMICVQGLMWFIYIFTEDAREQAQEQRVYNMLLKWQRELIKMGGVSRILPSPARFKNVNFGGFGSWGP